MLFYIWLFGTAIAATFLLGMLFAVIRNFWRTRQHADLRVASVLGLLLILALIANPIVNFMTLGLICESRVDAMFNRVKQSFIGRPKADIIAEFGHPDTNSSRDGAEYLRYDCRPWFVFTWTDVIVEVRNNFVEQVYLDD